MFPLYLAIFPPDHAYAIFGVFLVFTFWLYVAGLIIVFGAELNAFLRDGRSSVTVRDRATVQSVSRGFFVSSE